MKCLHYKTCCESKETLCSDCGCTLNPDKPNQRLAEKELRKVYEFFNK